MAQSDIDYENHVVSGLTAHCYSHIDARNSSKPVVVSFLLHMRGGSYKQVEPVAYTLLTEVYKQSPETDLYIISFDHRNHGERLIDPRANKSWEQGNELHAIDMYSMVYGAAQDMTMLVEFLPSYLFPQGREIKEFALVGISMGGHASWIALAKELRISLGCVIVGCPAYLELVLGRAQSSNIPLQPPYFPAGFLDTISRTYAGSVPYTSKESDNPFLGKRIFAQAGGDDTLVPWNTTEEFFNNLEIGEAQGGKKQYKIYPGVAHEYTDEMMVDAAAFFKQNITDALSGSHASFVFVSYTSRYGLTQVDIINPAKFRRLKQHAVAAQVSGLVKTGKPGVLLFEADILHINTFLKAAKALKYLEFRHLDTRRFIPGEPTLGIEKAGLQEIEDMRQLVETCDKLGLKEWFRTHMQMGGRNP